MEKNIEKVTREGGFATVFGATDKGNRRWWSGGIVGYWVGSLWPFLWYIYAWRCLFPFCYWSHSLSSLVLVFHLGLVYFVSLVISNGCLFYLLSKESSYGLYSFGTCFVFYIHTIFVWGCQMLILWVTLLRITFVCDNGWATKIPKQEKNWKTPL